MKKTIITTATVSAMLFIGSLTLSAANHAQIEKNAKESVRREIIRNISCPDFIEDNSITNQVKAIVQVDESGNIKVDEINSANPQLISYVKGQLQAMKVKNPGEGQKFVLVINFKID